MLDQSCLGDGVVRRCRDSDMEAAAILSHLNARRGIGIEPKQRYARCARPASYYRQ